MPKKKRLAPSRGQSIHFLAFDFGEKAENAAAGGLLSLQRRHSVLKCKALSLHHFSTVEG